MQATPAIEPIGRRRTIRARTLSALRGDKYMVDAYPAPGRRAPAAPARKES